MTLLHLTILLISINHCVVEILFPNISPSPDFETDDKSFTTVVIAGSGDVSVLGRSIAAPLGSRIIRDQANKIRQ